MFWKEFEPCVGNLTLEIFVFLIRNSFSIKRLKFGVLIYLTRFLQNRIFLPWTLIIAHLPSAYMPGTGLTNHLTSIISFNAITLESRDFFFFFLFLIWGNWDSEVKGIAQSYTAGKWQLDSSSDGQSAKARLTTALWGGEFYHSRFTVEEGKLSCPRYGIGDWARTWTWAF